MQYEFHVLNGRFNDAQLTNRYEQAYETFKTTWSEEFSTIKGQAMVMPSNDFTRQDYIVALYKEDTCVALDCMREVSLKSYVQTQDSWFQPWQQKHFETFVAQGNDQALVNSYFTVHKDHRRTIEGGNINTAFLTGCLSVLYQVHLGFDLMLGMMRNNRSMNSLGKMWGGDALETVTHNGVPTDLFTFEKTKIIQTSQKFPNYVLETFNSNELVKKGQARRERVA
ncbi:hypothetical protein [Bdellovibrio sp. KM01]|uniref:hypothetical protein n=1 Tax=Bdellovibrio sp. KM01 TaxID=2748865 RepID=UPI0015EABE22|nr:hypothetical protein [Bdellovibrio sp. KM01]QLY23861.1 hypothetical protein HW988_10175 [Bdellovibrio sp. KM01]